MANRPGRESLQQALESRPNQFDAMRLGFALLVVFGHCFVIADGASLAHPWGDPSRDWVYRLTGGQLFGATLGVDFFFLISGYLVTRSWLRSAGLGSYLLKRALRIYPAFLVVVCVGALVVGPLSLGPERYFGEFRGVAFVQSALLLQQPAMPAVFLDNPIARESNGSLWTIRYEATCYLMVALFGMLGLYRRRGFVVALFGVSLATVWLQANGFPDVLTYQHEIYPFGVPGM
jgi:peptidoglycan/LPS O-acetylase OafA/YrhL